MNEIGRKIYFDNRSGEIIMTTSERSGHVVETTTEQDFETFAVLKERDPYNVGFIQLEYGEYQSDFLEGALVSVDLETKTPLFTYPDPDNPTVLPDPIPPLSVEVRQIKQDQESLSSSFGEENALLNEAMGNLLIQSAADKATIMGLEETVGGLLFEVASLKGGAA